MAFFSLADNLTEHNNDGCEKEAKQAGTSHYVTFESISIRVQSSVPNASVYSVFNLAGQQVRKFHS
jgi:hypothetical protein